MTRLTKTIKDQIVASAMSRGGFAKREEELVKMRAEWAERVRIEALGGVEQADEIKKTALKIKNLMYELPSNVRIYDNYNPFVNQQECITVNCGGLRIEAYFNGACSYNGRLNHIFRITPRRHTIKANTELSKQLHGILKVQDQIALDKRNMEADVRAVLNSVTTVKKLLDVWPEASELIPTLPRVKDPKSNLPAIQPDKLNAVLGLPSK
jgi:hypothetical protein